MKTIIVLLFALMCFLYVAEISVSLHPFKIKFSNMYYAIGLFFILIGMSCIYYQGIKKGRLQAYDECIDTIEDVIKEKEK